MFTVNPINVSVMLLGERIQLNCSSFAIPVSNITWFKDGSLLSDTLVNTSVQQNQVTVSQLTITNLTFIDAGSYHCMAVNDLVSEQRTNSTQSQLVVNSK